MKFIPVSFGSSPPPFICLKQFSWTMDQSITIRFHCHIHLSCILLLFCEFFFFFFAAMIIPIFIPLVVCCAYDDVQHVLQMERLRKQTEERQEEMMQRSQTEADMLSEEL